MRVHRRVEVKRSGFRVLRRPAEYCADIRSGLKDIRLWKFGVAIAFEVLLENGKRIFFPVYSPVLEANRRGQDVRRHIGTSACIHGQSRGR